MPLETDVNVEDAKGGDYVAIPAGIYQVVIDDVSIYEGTKYKSSEKENNFMFKTRVIDDADYLNHQLMIFARIKWFTGFSKSGQGMSPSKLFSFVKAVYAFYNKKVDLTTIKPAEVNKDFINDLIGKQVNLVVEDPNKSGRNKVSGFSVIKKEHKLPADKVCKHCEKAKDQELVNPDDVPV